MEKQEMEIRIKRILHNRMFGFVTTEKEAQPIVDVIGVLANRGITVDCAIRILNDAEKIIPLITDFS